MTANLSFNSRFICIFKKKSTLLLVNNVYLINLFRLFKGENSYLSTKVIPCHHFFKSVWYSTEEDINHSHCKH